MINAAPIRPLHRTRFETSDPDVASEAIARMYTDVRLTLDRSPERTWFSVDSATADGIRVDRTRFGIAGRLTAGPVRDLIFALTVRGGWEVTSDGTPARMGPGEPVLYPTGVEVPTVWTDDFTEIVIPLSAEAVADHAAAVIGMDAEDVRFQGGRPVSPEKSRLWRRTVQYAEHELAQQSPALTNPIVQAELLDLLTAAALTVFPNTTLTVDEPDPSRNIAPVAVRRATAFIEANAERALTVTEIAAAAGIGVRGLQKAFLRHAGVSPIGFARRIRLERAHAELESAEPWSDVAVEAVAARWGFLATERFVAAYHEAYGESPDATLHR